MVVGISIREVVGDSRVIGAAIGFAAVAVGSRPKFVVRESHMERRAAND